MHHKIKLGWIILKLSLKKDKLLLGAFEQSGQDVGDDRQIRHDCCGQNLFRFTVSKSREHLRTRSLQPEHFPGIN